MLKTRIPQCYLVHNGSSFDFCYLLKVGLSVSSFISSSINLSNRFFHSSSHPISHPISHLHLPFTFFYIGHMRYWLFNIDWRPNLWYRNQKGPTHSKKPKDHLKRQEQPIVYLLQVQLLFGLFLPRMHSVQSPPQRDEIKRRKHPTLPYGKKDCFAGFLQDDSLQFIWLDWRP